MKQFPSFLKHNPNHLRPSSAPFSSGLITCECVFTSVWTQTSVRWSQTDGDHDGRPCSATKQTLGELLSHGRQPARTKKLLGHSRHRCVSLAPRRWSNTANVHFFKFIFGTLKASYLLVGQRQNIKISGFLVIVQQDPAYDAVASKVLLHKHPEAKPDKR